MTVPIKKVYRKMERERERERERENPGRQAENMIVAKNFNQV